MKMRTVTSLAIGAAVILGLGCRRTEEVVEVSVNQSGVSLAAASNREASGVWPGWRGPFGNGRSEASDVPVRWSDQNGLRWRVEVPGRGHSSPIVLNDVIVLATATEGDQKQLVIAYDRADGSERWRTVLHSGGFPSAREMHPKGSHANGTLVTDGETLYAAFLNRDKIVATALTSSGDIAWQQDVGAFASKFGYAPSPLLYGSFLIVAADNFGGGYLAALDCQTGKVAWRVARSLASSYSSPAVANLGGRDQLLISGGNEVTSYDPATGETLWSTPALAEATCGTVITHDDKLYASGGYPERETVCLDADGTRVWSNRTKLYEPSLAAAKGLLFGITDEGIAHCWDAATGGLNWKKRLGGSFSASPIIAENRVYISNLNGDTFVFRVSAETYQEVAQNSLGTDCYASPAVADGELYLRVGVNANDGRQEQLVCVTGVSTEADDGS